MSVRCSQPQVANLGGFNWHRLEGGAINVALLTANVWHRWSAEISAHRGCRDRQGACSAGKSLNHDKDLFIYTFFYCLRLF